MQLTKEAMKSKADWEAAGVALPTYDGEAMTEKTKENPIWVHFGAGNIFRGFIANLQNTLLEQRAAECGIIAAETFDYDVIDKIYRPYDNLTLLVRLHANGQMDKSVVASVAEGVCANSADAAQMGRLREIFAKPSLQMISYTITEKGYALRGMDGELLGLARADMEEGPQKARHAMSITAALLYERYKAGALPLALVSMDNCSHNGEKLESAVKEMASAWVERGFVPEEFLSYLADKSKVSFPWSMIDKITPRPAEVVEKMLSEAGIEAMTPIVTSKNTYIAPFVNAEVPEYLVIEDDFPAGRPALEKAGVYMTTRETVNNTERMKVTTCLNPLHTALAVYGCVLGYESISAEMGDAQLKALVEGIGLKEGMKVVTDPGIIRPEAFIREVIDERLPNPFIPDTPQRIATDTSQKVAIRFGETIKAYAASQTLCVEDLVYIPLALAGWLRYLMGIDDTGKAFERSGDPMLATLDEALAGIEFGKVDSVGTKVREVLKNANIFGVDLVAVGLADKIEAYYLQMIAAPGAVRKTLETYVG